MIRRRTASLMVTVAVCLVATAALVPISGRSAATPTPGEVHFTASGDFSANANTTAVLSQIDSIDPDLHLALGDLSYGVTGQEQAWCDFVHTRIDAGFPFELISGNHESSGQNGNINDFSACLPNQLPGLVGIYGREWYVDVPQVNPIVRFVMISPNIPFTSGIWNYAKGTSHYNWTVAAVDAARTKSIPWVVVGMHKPCLSVGQYSCEPGRDIVDLMMEKRVDLVLSGHEHLYQRTHQLAMSAGCPFIVPGAALNSACIADNDSIFDKGAGTIFATVGTGGISLRDVFAADPEAGYFAAMSGVNANPTWGSLDLKATATNLNVAFRPAAGGTFTDTFNIQAAGPPANLPPIARIVSSCSDLDCTFDGSTSTDSDGTIGAHSWDFGDGSTGNGSIVTHRYANSGNYTATLTVTDDDGGIHAATKTFSAGTPPNQPPIARMTVSCTGLTCTVDGRTSSDPDGTVAGYSWGFGDGAAGSSAQATHTYATAGSFTVSLTVTDNGGTTHTTTGTATPAAAATFAADTFGRIVSNGWGSADAGGAWTLTTAASNYSVSSGRGRLTVAAGASPRATLMGATSANTDLRLLLSADKLATGNGLYIGSIGRRTAAAGDYRAVTRVQSNGAISLGLSRTNSTGAETSIQPSTVIPGMTYATTDQLVVRMQVIGANPTTIRAKVWKVDAAEPVNWQRSITDSTAGLQVAGGVGVMPYLSSGATNGPIVVTLDDLTAQAQ